MKYSRVFSAPHKASNHQTRPRKTMPHLFSHPEKLYWITSKPFLIFCSAIWGPVSYQGKCITCRNILNIFFSGSVSSASYFTLIFLSVFSVTVFSGPFPVVFPLTLLLSWISTSVSLSMSSSPSSLLSSLCYSMSYFPLIQPVKTLLSLCLVPHWN